MNGRGSLLFDEYKRDKAKILDLTDEEIQEYVRNNVEVLTNFLSEIDKRGFRSLAEYRAVLLSRKYDFSAVQGFLEKTVSTTAKLEFLYQIETDYQREMKDVEPGEVRAVGVKSEKTGAFAKLFDSVPMGNFLNKEVYEFGESIRREIEKYEKIHRLNKDAKEMEYHDSQRRELMSARHRRSTENLNKSLAGKEDSVSNKRHPDLTLDRAVLLFHFVFKAANVNSHNTRKGKVINFLTGFSPNTSGDKFSDLYSKAEKNFPAFEEDMKFVRSYLAELGLTDSIRELDRDLEDMTGQMDTK